MVEQLTSNSQGRTKIIARNFALQFASQMYLKVYQLVIENETEEKIIEIAGNFVPVTPAQWRSRRDVAVDMTLGYGERDKIVEDMLVADKVLSEKQVRWYGDKQRSEEHTSELQSLMRISYAVFCLKKQTETTK